LGLLRLSIFCISTLIIIEYNNISKLMVFLILLIFEI